MYGLVVREETGLDAVTLASKLAEHGIETRPFFLGMHAQPVLQERGLFAGESYPVADRLAQQGLYLPSGLAMDERQVEYVSQTLHELLA
jgi:perosamine synthetase